MAFVISLVFDGANAQGVGPGRSRVLVYERAAFSSNRRPLAVTRHSLAVMTIHQSGDQAFTGSRGNLSA
jgi:hypothetical protein